MGHHIEKERNGLPALVFDGWNSGIADSPYSGVSNIRNLNSSYYPGVAYVNYKRQAATLSGGTMTRPTFSTTSPAGLIYILDDSQQVWKQNSVGSSTFTLLTGNPKTGGTGNGMAYWQNYLVVFRGTAIDICGDGTGDGGITSSNWNTAAQTTGVWPINLNTSVVLTGSPVSGDTSATISTYTDAQSSARSFWNGPTGNYQLTFGNGQTTTGTLTQGSANITWSPALYSNSSSPDITVTPVFAGSHMAFVSANNGNLYFCNGQFVGVLRVNAGYVFNKNVQTTYTFDYGVVRIQNETIGWLTELLANIVIAGINKIYLWDTVSANVQAPLDMSENITKMINVLNIVYVFAGLKGNIYQTNGYSISLLKKIPDSFFGLIDPDLQWGGLMAHRNKMYFQVFASTAGGSANSMGIFSLVLTSGQLTGELDTSGSLVMENQNSFGFTTTGSASANGILVDAPTSTFDMYYSAWYNNGTGGVDFNDTTLYTNFEPVIETDIVAIGTFLESRTFENVEYKLDRPMTNGDNIRLSYRTNLTDGYTTIGTTTATSTFLPLSDNFNSNVNNAQWIQFKAEFKCASSGSSRIPLREIRLHYII